MNADTLLGINLLYIILFIVPGLLGVKFYRREADVLDDDNRIDAIVYSIFLSIIAFYALYSLDWLSSGTALTVEDLIGLKLNDFYWGYLAVLSTAVLLGAFYGRYKYHLVNNQSFGSRREPLTKSLSIIFPNIGVVRACRWVRTKLAGAKSRFIGFIGLAGIATELRETVWRPFYDGDSSTSTAVWDQVFEETDAHVRVTTTKGDEISGKILDSGSFAQTRDLLLSIHDYPTDASEPWRWENMDYVYIHSQDISHIGLQDVDLDRKVIEELKAERDEGSSSTFRKTEVPDQAEISTNQAGSDQTNEDRSSEGDELMTTLLAEIVKSHGISSDEVDTAEIGDYELYFNQLKEEMAVDEEVKEQLEAVGELEED
ncbi:DUF6338 family protein [Halobacterium wangiae]|uniref:DUF6338 family protein n=1 Tax=Halobacterium wangiae TaxID=2902623 RepID=UPI001E5D4389|nr:DUF6338 family protein [Halobacterium wangiae]